MFSSWSQAAPALTSLGVGFTVSAVTGREVVPSKWPHFWFPSMASWKRMEKIAQLEPLVSRQGTEVGRGSEVVMAAAIGSEPITY